MRPLRTRRVSRARPYDSTQLACRCSIPASPTVSARSDRRCAILHMAVMYLGCRTIASRKYSKALPLSLSPLSLPPPPLPQELPVSPPGIPPGCVPASSKPLLPALEGWRTASADDQSSSWPVGKARHACQQGPGLCVCRTRMIRDARHLFRLLCLCQVHLDVASTPEH